MFINIRKDKVIMYTYIMGLYSARRKSKIMAFAGGKVDETLTHPAE